MRAIRWISAVAAAVGVAACADKDETRPDDEVGGVETTGTSGELGPTAPVGETQTTTPASGGASGTARTDPDEAPGGAEPGTEARTGAPEAGEDTRTAFPPEAVEEDEVGRPMEPIPGTPGSTPIEDPGMNYPPPGDERIQDEPMMESL